MLFIKSIIYYILNYIYDWLNNTKFYLYNIYINYNFQLKFEELQNGVNIIVLFFLRFFWYKRTLFGLITLSLKKGEVPRRGGPNEN